MPKLVLFLCTGNYYRSRYAEELFNHLARAEGIGWRAFSRGAGEKGSPDKIVLHALHGPTGIRRGLCQVPANVLQEII
jgi:protein-tyrosine phosphatase